MGTILFSYGRVSQKITNIIASDELVSAPASNLFLEDPNDVWETAALGNPFIEMQLPGDPWDLLGALYSNAADGDTWQLRTAATQATLTTGPGTDSGTVAMFPHANVARSLLRPAFYRPPAPITDPWLRIDFNVAPVSDTFFRMGNLVIDTAVAPARNFQYPLALGDPTRFDMRFMEQADALLLEDLALDCFGDPVLVVFDPDQTEFLHHYAVWGKERTRQGARLTRTNKWTRSYEITPFIGRDE